MSFRASGRGWGLGTYATNIQPGKPTSKKTFNRVNCRFKTEISKKKIRRYGHFKCVTFSYDQCLLGVVESGMIGLFSLASLSIYTIILWTSIKVKKTTITKSHHYDHHHQRHLLCTNITIYAILNVIIFTILNVTICIFVRALLQTKKTVAASDAQ